MAPGAAGFKRDFAFWKRPQYGRQRRQVVKLRLRAALVQNQRGKRAALRSERFKTRRGDGAEIGHAVGNRGERQRDRDADSIRLMASGAAIERTRLVGEK